MLVSQKLTDVLVYCYYQTTYQSKHVHIVAVSVLECTRVISQHHSLKYRSHWYILNLHKFSFNVLTLLVGCWDDHLGCEKNLHLICNGICLKQEHTCKLTIKQ